MYRISLMDYNVGLLAKEEFTTVAKCKVYAKQYSPESFYGYIYNLDTKEMEWHIYFTKTWKRCDNYTFLNYY
jgi:hypothetical protein